MKVSDRTKKMTSTQTKLMRVALAVIAGIAGLYLDVG
jgi:hypothetical protein